MSEQPSTRERGLPWGRRRWLRVGAGASGIVAALLVSSTVLAAIPNYVDVTSHQITYQGTPNTVYGWGNNGTLSSPTTPLGGTWTRNGTGGLFDGGTFEGNTTPPLAPSETAAASADPNIIAAKFVVDPLSGDTTACGLGDPSVFGSGSQTNNTAITGLTFKTGSVPQKDDLGNVYAAAVTDPGSGHEIVYFGAERVVNNGDSHVDFEFLQSGVTIPAGCGPGSFAGHRTSGDLLLSVDFLTGGALGDALLHVWSCNGSTWPGNSPAGTICDPTGKQGSPAYVDVTSSSLFDAVQVGVNSGATAIGEGGWVGRNANGTPTTTVATNEFMDGGIDLTALGFNSCVSTFLPHTRSSQSFTSQLKDFAGPIPFNTCKTPTVATLLSATTVEVGTPVTDQATLTGATSNAGGTVTYNVYSNNTCTGTPVFTDTENVVNGVVDRSAAFAAGTGPIYNWQAVYSGDIASGGRNEPATSACGTETETVIHPSTSLTFVSQSPSGTVEKGTSVTITVNEANTGDSALTGVAVTGTPTACATWTPVDAAFAGNLAVGASEDFTCTFTAADGTNSWSAAGAGTDSLNNPVPTSGESTNGSFQGISPSTSLTFVSQSVANPVPASSSVTLTVTEKNTGDTTLTGVSVTGTGCTTWTPVDAGFAGTLTAGQTENFTCTFTVGTTDLSWTADGHGTDSLNNPVPTGPGTPEEVTGTIHVAPPGQGCTPGFWQGGLGVTLWNTASDPDWAAHGGVGTNPFVTTDVFTSFFTATGDSSVDSMTMLAIVGTGGTSNWAQKAARDLIAAYLNASFGMQYPYTTSTILSDWSTAVAGGTSGFQAFHAKYSAANALLCPIG